MQALNIAELSGNDGWQIAARKINQNFNSLYKALTVNGNDNEDVIGRIEQMLGDAEARIDKKITDAIESINGTIADARDEFNELLKKAVPQIGTYLFSETDPNTIWPNTEWTKIAEGTYLTAAGDTYKSGSKYGENMKRLTTTEMPNHHHVIVSNTHNSNSSTASLVFTLRSGNNGARLTDTTGDVYTSTAMLGGNPIYTDYTGEGKSFSIMPQSIAAPLWKRVS